MTSFRVPKGFGRCEDIVNKSRFIGRVWPVTTEAEALGLLKGIREAEREASHHVFAYRLRDEGVMRYSDDGEPSGTAGLPLMEAFLRQDIYNFLCISTRYFGGVLLGAGGLVRAYARSGSNALGAAGVAVMRLWTELRLSCPYALFERVKLELAERAALITQTDYGAEVSLLFSLPADQTEPCRLALSELSAGALAPERLRDAFLAL